MKKIKKPNKKKQNNELKTLTKIHKNYKIDDNYIKKPAADVIK